MLRWWGSRSSQCSARAWASSTPPSLMWNRRTAVGYWGGLLRVLDAEGKRIASHQFQHDVTGVVWLGEALAVGLSDGRVVCLQVR